MKAAETTLGAVEKLPYDIWTSVFFWLAGYSTTVQLLDTRLVCRLFDSAVREERTAYQAVLAAQGRILRNNAGQVVRFSECPVVSWWAVLMDQVRMDRTWLGAPGSPADKGIAAPRRPVGYEVTLLSHAAHEKYDILLYYDWACASINPFGESVPESPSCRDDNGAIGFLAHRKRLRMKRNNKSKKQQVRSMRYLAVHIIDYPTLLPIVTHTFFHRGFGWRTNLADLPRATNVSDNHILSVDAPWITTLLLVDHKRSQYAMAYTDEFGVSALVLRSYAESAPSNGKTVGSFFFEGYGRGALLRIVDDNTYRFYYTDNVGDSFTHMHLLSREKLAPVSKITVPVETHFFDHFPEHNRNLLMVASMHGEVSFWNVETGQLQEWIQATPGHQLHVMFFRPLFRPGLLAESPSSVGRARAATANTRCVTTSCPIHEQRPWIQLVIGWLNCLPGLEHLAQNMGTCLFNVGCLPLDPRKSIDQLNLPPADRPPFRPNQGVRSLSMILGTPFLAGDTTGHLLAVLQPNGRVVMIDLRVYSSPMQSRSYSNQPTIPIAGLQKAETTPLWFMSRATREYVLVHGELLYSPLTTNGDAHARALGKTKLRLVARRIHGEKLQGAVELIHRGHGSALSINPHAVAQSAQVMAAEDSVSEASDGGWEDEEEVTEIAPGHFVSIEHEAGTAWSSEDGDSGADPTSSNIVHEEGIHSTTASDAAANSSTSDDWSQWEDESDSSQNEESGTDWSDSSDEENENEWDQDEWSQQNAGDLNFLDSRGDAMLIYRGTNLVLLRRVRA